MKNVFFEKNSLIYLVLFVSEELTPEFPGVQHIKVEFNSRLWWQISCQNATSLCDKLNSIPQMLLKKRNWIQPPAVISLYKCLAI